MNQADPDKIGEANAAQLEVYRNIYEVCKEHFNNSIAHLDALHSKANSYLSYLTLLTAMWGILVTSNLDDFTKRQVAGFWETSLIVLFFITLLCFVVTLASIIRVIKLTNIEGPPSAAEIPDKFYNKKLLDFYYSMAEHYKKVAVKNSTSVRRVERRLSWAYVLLAVSLLLFAVSAGTTMLYKFCQISFTQEDIKMGDENTQQTNNNTGNSSTGNNSQTPPPALEKPVLVPLNAEPLKRGVGSTEIPKLVLMTPEALKYSENKVPKTTGNKK